MQTYHIVHILPIIQRDELESRQHGPEEVVEVGVPVVGVGAHAQARVRGRTVARARQVAADDRRALVIDQPVGGVFDPSGNYMVRSRVLNARSSQLSTAGLRTLFWIIFIQHH